MTTQWRNVFLRNFFVTIDIVCKSVFFSQYSLAPSICRKTFIMLLNLLGPPPTRFGTVIAINSPMITAKRIIVSSQELNDLEEAESKFESITLKHHRNIKVANSG
jgi:hypothetical protein